MKKIYIYVLKCPETLSVRYVGKSIDPKSRYYDHANLKELEKVANRYSSNWLKSLLKRGLKPIMEIIDETTEDWKSLEIKWIAFYKEQGCKLTNLSEGGGGGHGIKWSMKRRKRHSEIFKKIHPQWMKGKKLSEEHKKNLSKNNPRILIGNKLRCIPIKLTNLKTGETLSFDCAGDAAKHIDTDVSYLCKVLKKSGKIKGWQLASA